MKPIISLIQQEGWTIEGKGEAARIRVYDERYPITHPVAIHLKIYRTSTNPETRYLHFKKAHDYLWPDTVWHYWTERRFKAHCAGWNYIGWAGGASTAKAQPLTAKIKTPWGWTTMGELQVGDIISSTAGAAQKVLAIHPQGIKSIYRVSFSDGSSTEATADHLWRVQSKKQRDRSNQKFHIYTTLELSTYLKRSLSIPPILPWASCANVRLSIDPWLLGYYIANGNMSHKSLSPSITVPTKKIAHKIKKIWGNVLIKKVPHKNCYWVRLYNFRPTLKKFPTLWAKKSTDKTIPNIYMHASVSDRLALLQGLMDGDGSVNKAGAVSASFSNALLSSQCCELARGLGYVVSLSGPKKSFYTKNLKKIRCQDNYRLYISIPPGLPPPVTKTIPKKASRLNHRTVTSVEYLREDYAQCITVSHENSLYLTDNFIPTHNSFDAAKIALLFWFANPEKRGVIIASTTLVSLTARVWGYTTKLLNSMQVRLPFQYLGGTTPQVLFPAKKGGGADKKIRDTLHGIFAVAAKQGGDDDAISSWIGRHPDESLLLILDEATDLNPAITKAFPNLDSSGKPFQCLAIGNSNSKSDLHGAICTPKAGWESVDPMQHTQWETTQKNGICLFFSCYESPAIYESNPEVKKKLSVFLITKEQIDSKEKTLGKNSESFWRFVLGFWASSSTENVILSKQFLNSYNIGDKAVWLGINPLNIVAGLDPAFSTGGDSCILRLALLGQDTEGGIVLDYRQESLVFNIPITAQANESAELQIAKQVLEILDKHSCPLHHLCIDATGQGRALGGVLFLHAGGHQRPPIKVYNVRIGKQISSTFDVTVHTPYELWFNFRNFISHKQIKGLDKITIGQLSSRLILGAETGRPKLEGKRDYKKRMAAIMPALAHSPDEADAASLTLLSAMMNFGFYPGEKKEIPKVTGFQHEKLLAYKQQMRMQEETHDSRPGIPSASFSSDLSEVVKLRRPF